MKTRTFLLFLIVGSHPGCAEGTKKREYRHDIRREAGVKFLKLTTENGFHKLDKIYFLVDPKLGEVDSECNKGLNKFEYFKPLFKKDEKDERDKRAELFIRQVVEDLFKDFFDVICYNPEPRKSIEVYLRGEPTGEQKLLATVSTRFWVDTKADSETTPKEFNKLNCQVELRLFKIRLKDDDKKGRNIDRLEMLFSDTSIGTIPSKALKGKEPKWAIQAVLIDALKDRLAVNFAMNPRFNTKDVVTAVKTDILGPSISEYTTRSK